MLRSQIQALQNAQVQQAIDAKQTQAAIGSMEKLLQRIVARDDSRGRSRSRRDDSTRSDRRQPSQDNLPEDDQPIRTTEVRESPSHSDTTSTGNHKRSAKVPDPLKLSNGIQPTFDFWHVQIIGKFEVNADHFYNEAARMYYVFNMTEGDSQKYLYERYKPDAADRFVNYQEMIQHLRDIYSNPYRKEEARYEYQALRMGFNQPFHEFKTRFIHLADEAQIPHSQRFNDMFDKLTLTLKDKAVTLRGFLNKDFNKLCTHLAELDFEIKRLKTQRAQEQRDRTTGAVSTTTSAAIPAVATTREFAPAKTYTPLVRSTPALTSDKPRQSTPFERPAIECYNCRKLGHMAKDCTEPKRAEVKEIEGEDEEPESGNDYA